MAVTTLYFGDTFDHYKTADILQKWSAVDLAQPSTENSIEVDEDYARPGGGGQGLRLGFGGDRRLRKILTQNITTLSVMAAWIYFESGSAFSTNNQLLAFKDNGTEQLSLRIDSSGHLIVSRNGSTLATSTSTVTFDTWYWIEFGATIHNSTGTYEVRVNGSSTGWIAPTTGADTANTANNYFNEVALGVANSITRYDDFLIVDDFPGMLRGVVMRPVGAGNYAQWTGNYGQNFENVREELADGDTTFNQTSAAGNKDTFAMDDVPNGTIVGIQLAIQARQDTGAARTFRPIQRSGGTDYNGTTVNLGASYTMVLEPRVTNPATSAAYTTSDLNGAEFGYELVS